MLVYNGEEFLEEALDSLLAQDYENFELIILDNLSIDKTNAICQRYARKDARIKYILDTQRRNGHDAGNYIASFARGQYYMMASDDDLWDRSYITKLVTVLMNNCNIGLAYSDGYFIDYRGMRLQRIFSSKKRLLKYTNSKPFNFCHYLILRSAVPALFGIYRTDVFRKVLPFTTFDATVADVDNLFILRLLTFTLVHGIEESLFYFRVYPAKERWEDVHYGRYPQNKSKAYMRIYMLRHELRFNHEIFRMINKTQFNFSLKICLALLTVFSMVVNVFIKPLYIYVKKL